MSTSSITEQTGVVAYRANAARFLVLRLKNKDLNALRRQVVKFYETRHLFTHRNPALIVNTALSFGYDLWQKLHPDPAVPGFHKLESIEGPHPLPALDADIFVHLSAENADICFTLARSLLNGWDDVEVLDERMCFTHMEGRDLTGFVDGIENPLTMPDRQRAVLITDGPYQGGAFLLAQRFVHDLNKWHTTSIDEQQRTFGRTKLQGVEFPDDQKPANAHIARVNIGIDVVRHNMPYGDASGDQGVFFILYAQQLSTIDTQLKRMFGQVEDGITDHLLDFTRSVGGAYYFAPSQTLLNEIMGVEDD